MGAPRRITKYVPPALLLAVLLGLCRMAAPQLACPIEEAEAPPPAPDNDPTALIAGGTPAVPCRYPYMASLAIEMFGLNHICGGTLVHESWILTAASCVDPQFTARDVSNPMALLNGLEWSKPETFRENIATVAEELQVHPSYKGDPDSGYNVALLKLEVPSNQTPVALIAPGEDLQADELVAMAGWGRSAGTGAFSATLLEATDIQLVDPDACTGFGVEDNTKVFCTGFGDKSSCKGDEGGPVLRRGENASEDVQVGVVTTQLINGVASCGLFGRPAKFTGLSHLIEWIGETVNGTT